MQPLIRNTHPRHSLSRLTPRSLLTFGCCLLSWAAAPAGRNAIAQSPLPPSHFDVVVYSASPAGIAAALAAAAEGCTVLLAEPSSRIGGMLTSGLSHTDFRTFEGLSGTFLEFTRRVERHYQQTYGPDSRQLQDCFRGTRGEPHVNLRILEQMLAEAPLITVRRQLMLNTLSMSPGKSRIESLNFEVTSPTTSTLLSDSVTCGAVIDASCEGDLLALSGEPWQAGREARDQFHESLAPETADNQLQASNFRFILTRDPRNRREIEAPDGYRPEDFSAVTDILNSGRIRSVFGDPSGCIFKAHQPPLPNEKYDINDVSGGLIRLSLPGLNQEWLQSSSRDRAAIHARHLRDQAGLLYYLQHDPSVPQVFREEAAQWGWCRDEFPETSGLPPRLYLREGRRMLGQHLYIQRDSEHAPSDARALLHADAIACGDYGHNCHGTGRNGNRFEGRHTGEFYQQTPPYQIPFGVIVPRTIENLLVPVAVSASHAGFCALRYEPIRSSLGQAAGYAAAHAIHHQVPVQQVHVPALQQQITAAGSAVLYVSDVPPDDPDFAAVQWWGLQGGLHGLAKTPPAPNIRGNHIFGQYFAAYPDHSANLQQILTPELAQRWQTIAVIAGLLPTQLPPPSTQITRGEFIRETYRRIMQTPPSQTNAHRLPHAAPRLNPAALPGIHAPGEVDLPALAAHIIRNAHSLPGIIVDDCDAELQGEWQYSTHTPPYVGRGYLHDKNDGKGEKSVTYRPQLPADGLYEVRLSHCRNIRRATNTLVVIHHADGETSLRINQQQQPEFSELFRSLGKFRFKMGNKHWVRISNADTTGKYVIADAIQWLPVPTP